MKATLFLSVILFLSLSSMGQTVLKLRAKKYATPENIVLREAGDQGLITKIGQYILQYQGDQTYAYRGGIIVHDTVRGISRQITIPLGYSHYLGNEGNFIEAEGNTWRFTVKGNLKAHGDKLPSRRGIDGGTPIIYSISTRNNGKSWKVSEVEKPEELREGAGRE